MTNHHTATEPLSTISPPTGAFARDVLRGLHRAPKRLPSKYFYDGRGAELFELICETEEYYVTRTEAGLMEQYAVEMGQAVGEGCMLIELGSGNTMKTRLLLDHLERPAAYVPVDLAYDQLIRTARELRKRYPALEVLPAPADFTRKFGLPDSREPARRRVIYFPGSTVGNFHPPQAQRLFFRLGEVCGPGGGMLIGIDLKKDRQVLERAYNDGSGVTAAFNKNMLVRINRELGAQFDVDRFRHLAYYNPDKGRIEMHLVSCTRQTVEVLGRKVSFAAGESIRTECSYKFNAGEFWALAAAGGWRLQRTWTDHQHYFAVLYLTR